METSSSIDIAEQLIDLLTRQQLLYRQLRELAKKQTDLVDGSDPELLLRILAARQRVIDHLTAIGCQLQPIRDDWVNISRMLTPDQRQETQRLIDSVQQILGEILTRDEKDFNTLSSRKLKVSEEIRRAAAGKRMNQAYAQSGAAGQNRFLDTQSE